MRCVNNDNARNTAGMSVSTKFRLTRLSVCWAWAVLIAGPIWLAMSKAARLNCAM
ncbi:hypothetical protein D3C73_1364970 [compost metagenome]